MAKVTVKFMLGDTDSLVSVVTTNKTKMKKFYVSKYKRQANVPGGWMDGYAVGASKSWMCIGSGNEEAYWFYYTSEKAANEAVEQLATA